MSTRADVLELAILGQLGSVPMHGYELRRRLSAQLGAFRTLSYGSLYPALRRLTEAGLITQANGDTLPHALAGRRARIVYRLTDAGRERLASTLATAEPAAWDDEAFDVRFTLFGVTDARTRLRILEGRRARMLERLAMLRESTQRARERMDSYTAELVRHGLEQVEREVEWLENLIDTERGTPGALDLRPPGPAAGPPSPDRPDEGAAPSTTSSKEQE
ncbi:helix-turn-helix transcriptional regulator [Georgenia wutianyii]|uniref:Helix-turn-helix transcriptional regulator n=1 Tax=Georgenia wutianyii TaxID=2585135 RepID=A0ABX5VSA1_9MICO|nr:PadR family transcriptional regulator [Georgenia wutianyii]QDB80576.1 helix-turn-helix transcriptional regulator [Georgenia wutianyii]